MYMTPELVAFLLGILIPKLEEVAVVGEENRAGLVPFRFFRKKDWKIFTIIVNELIKNRLVNVKRDEYGKIEKASTGFTEVTVRELRYVLNGKLIVEHDEEFLGWQTLMRMYAFHRDEYEKVFSERSLDLVCIACGYDGIRGLFKDEDIDPWLFLSF